jgi:hypothetical protein
MQPRKPLYAEQVGVGRGNWLQWHIYICESCGGLVGAATRVNAGVRISAKYSPPVSGS